MLAAGTPTNNTAGNVVQVFGAHLAMWVNICLEVELLNCRAGTCRAVGNTLPLSAIVSAPGAHQHSFQIFSFFLFFLLACFLLLSLSFPFLSSFLFFNNCSYSDECTFAWFYYHFPASLSIFTCSHMLIGQLYRLFCEVPFSSPDFKKNIFLFSLIDKQGVFIYSDKSLVSSMYCNISGSFLVCISKCLFFFFFLALPCLHGLSSDCGAQGLFLV